MNAPLVQQVWQRAGYCCEYCRMPQDFDDIPFEIDHIIARKHRGPSTAGNLALSCFHCNSFKGSDIGLSCMMLAKYELNSSKPCLNPESEDSKPSINVLVFVPSLSGGVAW